MATPASFASALEKSFSLEKTTQSWCEKCGDFQLSLQARRTKSLPDVLVVNWPADLDKPKIPAVVHHKVNYFLYCGVMGGLFAR